MNILVVEDEKRLAGLVVRAMTKAGHTAESACDGPAATEAATAQRFDVIVLDVNLPGYDGFEVLRRLREARVAARVLLLTARAEVTDRVSGLRAGADDYLTKPFAMEELLARVEVLGRRETPGAQADVLEAGNLRMEIRRRRVTRDEVAVALSPREFDLLLVFMQEPGRVFTRDELCEHIWEREHEYDTRTVEIFIMRLRKKLDDGSGAPLIETFRGVGYALRAPR